jgi:malonyl CoA-acyl carrier protein transacylase
VSDIKKVAYVFPGQGAQTVGMGKDLYDSFDSIKVLFKQADALKDLKRNFVKQAMPNRLW